MPDKYEDKTQIIPNHNNDLYITTLLPGDVFDCVPVIAFAINYCGTKFFNTPVAIGINQEASITRRQVIFNVNTQYWYDSEGHQGSDQKSLLKHFKEIEG